MVGALEVVCEGRGCVVGRVAESEVPGLSSQD